MPSYPGLKSLQETCLNSIVDNMDRVWCQHFLKEMNQTHWLFVEGPFDSIPPQMCDTLISKMQAKRLFKRHHIYLLVNPGLKSLSLDHCNEANCNLVLQLLSVRCSKLNKLDLTQSKFKEDFFNDFCRKWGGNLTELRLSKTPITDNEMAIIGKMAGNLRHLDISDNTRISDKGLRVLHKPVNLQGKPDSSYGKCTKLYSLDLRGTSMSIKAVSSLLKSLSETLSEFEFGQSFLAVFNYLSNHDAGLLKLRKLEIDMNTYLEDNDLPPLSSVIEFVSQLCPFVQRIFISYGDSSVTSDELLPLINESRTVTSIFLLAENGYESMDNHGATFRTLMFHQGSNLRDVTLVGIGGVSLTDLINCCPNLENLHLDFNSYLLHQESVNSNQPLMLKSFRLHCNPSSESTATSPSTSELGAILTQSNQLTTIDITGCDQFTDLVFLQLWRASNNDVSLNNNFSFCNLKKLRLADCNFISLDALSVITHCSNQLKDLVLDRCRLIHRSHIEVYNKYLAQNRYLVNLHWS